jgi:L-rhamnose mutarotase
MLMRIESHNMADLPNKYIMKKWWTHMADIMQTYPNNEPVITELTPVFYMP